MEAAEEGIELVTGEAGGGADLAGIGDAGVGEELQDCQPTLVGEGLVQGRLQVGDVSL